MTTRVTLGMWWILKINKHQECDQTLRTQRAPWATWWTLIATWCALGTQWALATNRTSTKKIIRMK